MADFGIGETAAAAGFLAAESAATTAGAAAATTTAAAAGAAAAASTAAATTYGGLTVAQWIAVTSTAASLGGTELTIAQQRKAALGQAGMSDLAVKAALAEASSKTETAAYNERQFRRKAGFLMGEQVSEAAASGTALGGGSNLFHEIDTARQTEMEAENIRRQGDAGAAASRFEAGLAGMRGKYLRNQADLAIGAGAVQGADSILSSWAKLKRGGYG